ncbi:MAG: hypothetical protein Q9220_003984 [cf. Caloplaca sp. 1 TL-2023]
MGNSGSTVRKPDASNDQSPAPTDACPVNHEARQAWLDAAAKNSPTPTHPQILHTPSSAIKGDNKLDGGDVTTHKTSHGSPIKLNSGEGPALGIHRVTSSIPRADTAPSTTTPDPRSLPSTESNTSAHLSGGNWIYPSEKMFFDAMKRKSFSPKTQDMPAIVPIHNAVNERAWSLIKQWESSSARLRHLNTPCGGPKLRSFSGDAAKLSPKARVMGWVGYQEPFDRHDWVVERCEADGGGVEYVIDFYKGKGDGLAFYLDVRPKLNSWEGWRMRVGSLVGLG